MSKLNKVNSGLLFFDDFSERTLMWTQSPSDTNAVSFGDNGLQMLHNQKYTTFTIVEPQADEYSCIVKLDHIPLNKVDIAGVIVMSNTREYAECQSFMATSPYDLNNSDQTEDIKNMITELMTNANYVQWSLNDEDFPAFSEDNGENNNEEAGNGNEENNNNNGPFVDTIYHYIKFNKTKGRYVFWASPDGYSWIEVGNVSFTDSGVIGFFLYGTHDQELIEKTHCYFNSFAIYNSKYIVIDGVDKKYEAEIYDENGTILLRTDNTGFNNIVGRTENRLVINTNTLPMPIKKPVLRIFSPTNYSVTIDQHELEEIYGGDTFNLERDIRAYINNQEIDMNVLYDLGTFYRGSYYVKLDIHNHEEYTINNVKVKVIRYSEYHGGESEVNIALCDENRLETDLI